jgi:tripartite-type tricarboxylate transporter receptor subunit TctC
MWRPFWAAAVGVAMVAIGGIASAQSAFPAKPVHILVPYAAGGGVDILARTLGDVVSRQWGQTVVVENRPGAGGVVASQALVSAPPDGYTLIVVASGHATNPFLYAKIPYDTFKDFTPISLLASSPNILLVRADSPFKNLSDVIAQAKTKPGGLSVGHAGNGTSTHLACELLKNLAKIDIEAIPYKGLLAFHGLTYASLDIPLTPLYLRKFFRMGYISVHALTHPSPGHIRDTEGSKDPCRAASAPVYSKPEPPA